MQKFKFWLAIPLSLLFCSCSIPKSIAKSNHAHRNNVRLRKERKDSIANYPTYTAAKYIERFKDIAIQEMNLYGIPASITLAQGLFESGTGNGDLARVANNHFGIKCNSEWTGKIYYKDDDQVNDQFRVYDKAEDSFRDHSEFLKKKRYARLFELDKYDYEGWARGLKEAGYATNPKYPELLINVIKKYNLDQYDHPEGEFASTKQEDGLMPRISNATVMVRDSVNNNNNNSTADKIYTVKQGDTLYSISRRFGLTVDEVKALNNMPDYSIRIGQKLLVSR